MKVFWDKWKRLLGEEDGPTAVEYATLIAVICGGAITTLSQFGDKVHVIYVSIQTALTF